MTPNARVPSTAELRKACDTSVLDTEAIAEGINVLGRRKSGFDVGNGGTSDEYDLLTESQGQTDEEFSLLSSFSEEHAQQAGAFSRHDSGFLQSSSSEIGPDELNRDLYISRPDACELVSPSHIEELDSELVSDDTPRLCVDPFDKGTDAAIALAPLRGQGLPVLPSRPTKGVSSDRSQITDLGAHLANLKADGETPPADSPANHSVLGVPLQDRIFAEYCPTEQERKGFCPKGRLESLIQENVVIDELTKCLSDTVSPRKIQEYARQICPALSGEIREEDKASQDIKSYRKVFAILVLVEKVATIGKFIDDDLHDGHLPLRRVELKGIPGTFELRRRKEISPRLECFDTWSRMNVRNFEEYQWTILAPFFSRGGRNDVMFYVLPDQTILPFTTDNGRQGEVHEIEEFEGGFGWVSKVKIHPDHHNFHNTKTSDRAFAIKRLKSQNMQIFKREFDMLAKFSDDAHDHLVSLLAAYKHFNAFHLIFHWADADLIRFWKLVEPSPVYTYERVVWVARQCAGLASGLLKIHRYESVYESRLRSKSADAELEVQGIMTSTKLYGLHGDIKPANILWFRDSANPDDSGTLKISDFGLTELHTDHSRSNRPKSQVGNSQNYRPPEYDLVDGTISRSYDIWTIGCLYLEFITWLLGGWSLVKSFAIMRAAPGEVQSPEDREYTFFELEDGGKSARLKDCVSEFIKYLHSRPVCTEYLHEFLNMIEYDMLLIETSDLRAGKRIECGRLYQKLDEMYRKCVIVPEYALTPAAWNQGAAG